MTADVLPNIPADFEAEAEILRGCLDPRGRGVVFEMLGQDDDLHAPHHRRIFAAIVEISTGGEEITPWSLRGALERDAGFISAGGLAQLDGLLILDVPSLANLADACRRVKRLATKRRLLYLGDSLAEKAGSPTTDVGALLEEFSPKFEALRNRGAGLAGRALHISEIVKDLRPQLERAAEGRGLMLGVSTGFPSLDAVVPGFIPSNFIVLAARPSVGKTAFGCELALRQCQAGNPVAFYSVEMDAPEILMRLACRHGRVDYQRVASGNLSRDGMATLLNSIAHVSQLPLWIDPRPDVRATELRWRLVALAKREKIRLAIVDYLQLLNADGENRTAVVTNVSRELKTAARELGATSQGTLLAMAQLNRSGTGEEPQLHHLRESGQSEQDADVVAFLYDQKPDKILSIAKQRNGPLDKIRLQFFPPFMGFDELD